MTRWSPGRSPTFNTRDENRLKRIIKTNIGASTKAIFEKFQAENPTHFSRATIYRHLKKMNLVRRSIRKSVVVKQGNRIKRVKWLKQEELGH